MLDHLFSLKHPISYLYLSEKIILLDGIFVVLMTEINLYTLGNTPPYVILYFGKWC